VKLRSIRARLTAWYALILMMAFAGTGMGAWVDMRDSIHDMADADLRTRLSLLRNDLANEPPEERSGSPEFFTDLSEASAPWVRIAEGGRWIYESPAAVTKGAATPDVARLPRDGVTRTLTVGDHSFRLLTAPVATDGATWGAELGLPIDNLYETLDHLAWTVALASPLVLLLASAGGYWMSRHALAPVDRITRTAQTIGAHNLDQRLPISGSDDELDRLSGTLNSMVARLEDAFRQVTQFTADASHELRTPVAVIRTAAELARTRSRTEAEYVKALDQIVAESERTTRLIDDLLLLARADANVEALALEPMDLSECLREACADGEVLAAAAGLRFDVDLPAACRAVGDPQALRRLFLILLDNAIKYTPRGGTVAVTMTCGGTEAVVDVRDNGLGIAPEDVPHLFERFYRVDADRSRATGGAGLGLSIALWIANRHHGAIAVDSSAGNGSVFRVTLPVDSAS
jgi:heavy metal sensor kinase